MSNPDAGKKLILTGIGVFGAACVGLFVAGWVIGPPESDVPGFAVSEEATELPDGTYRFTVDSTDLDSWVGFSFELGRHVPEGAASDILLRRHYIRSARGAMDLGKGAIGEAAVPGSPEWEQDIVVDNVERSPILSGWYSYSYMTHLLKPKGKVFAVPLAAGGIVLMQVESYYCDPEGTGCMTLRYKLPTG